jgi:hypothetical protein
MENCRKGLPDIDEVKFYRNFNEVLRGVDAQQLGVSSLCDSLMNLIVGPKREQLFHLNHPLYILHRSDDYMIFNLRGRPIGCIDKQLI